MKKSSIKENIWKKIFDKKEIRMKKKLKKSQALLIFSLLKTSGKKNISLQ